MKKTLHLVIRLGLAMLIIPACQADRPVAPDEIARRIREMHIEADDLHASLEVTLDSDVLQDHLFIEVWEKKPDKVRIEVLETDNADWRGAILVTSDQRAWLYNPNRQQVTVGNRDQVRLPLVQDVVFAMRDLLRTTEANRIQVLGIVEVVGSDAYKLAYSTPKDRQATVWIDRERWLPLRVEYEDRTLGRGTVIFHRYETNRGLTEDLFQFQPPPDAQVISSETTTPQAITLDQAVATASFPLLVPSYTPPDTHLSQVFELSRSFALCYEGPHPFTLVQSQNEATARMPASDGIQHVALRGTQAIFVADASQGGIFLAWEENGVRISIAGAMSREEAIRIAESLSVEPGVGGNWSIRPASS